MVELDPDDPRYLPTYSKGMRQRVKVAQALVHDPSVIVLDEPLTGLDPRQRLHLIDLFHRLGDEGRCVIVSSHVLDEVERFGSGVLVIAQGRLAAEGDFHAIRDLMDDRPHRIRLRTDRPQRAGRSAARRRAACWACEVVDADTVIVDTDRRCTPAPHRRRRRPRRGRPPLGGRPPRRRPRSVFRYLVGR